MTPRGPQSQLKLARRLRREMTAAEAMLRGSLRNRGIGAKFRRQVPIGSYVADFACVEAKLIVELDGPLHELEERHRHDKRRDAWLSAQGWIIFRFPNDLVIGGGDIVVERIRQNIGATAAPSSDPR